MNAHREDRRPTGALSRALNEAATLHQAGRLDEAAQRYEAALGLDRRQFETLHRFGVLRAQQGRLSEAVELLREAVERKRDSGPAHTNLGMALNLLGKTREALPVLERAVALGPGDPLAHNNLGIALRASGRAAEARTALERAVALQPDHVEALTNLGATLLELGRADEALPVTERALAVNPRFPGAHVTLGTVLRGLGRWPEALAAVQRALALEPRNSFAWAQLGGMYLDLGRLAEARRAYERALELDPGNCRILSNLVQCGTMSAGDPCVPVLESLAASAGDLPETQRISLNFALGKTYADLGEPERSFAAYLEGNRLKRRHVSFDESADLGLFERVASVFSEEFLGTRAGLGQPSDRPVFIVGMMRSGSTLVEQVLASHPQVFGAGERSDFNEAYKMVRASLAPGPSYPDSMRVFTAREFRALGEGYLERLARAAGGSGAARITDKMPGNFSSIGLIHLALPSARIIHTRRDPIDTCLSCFSKLFADSQPFTYDLGELGRYYRAYERLMEHWRRVLPAGVMLEVRYEDVVADLEREARRIVAFCGLEWSEACLAFHETDRPVLTASAAQVRQPLYRSAVGRRRPPPELMRPLLEGLGLTPAGAPDARA